MSIEQTRATLDGYLEALVARGDYGRYLADDATVVLVGTEHAAQGREATVGLITGMHTQAFDARPEVTNRLVDDGKAAVEAVFVGTHTGEFAGIPATGRAVRVPYSVLYDIAGDRITALRIYLPVHVLLEQLGAGAAAESPPVVAPAGGGSG